MGGSVIHTQIQLQRMSNGEQVNQTGGADNSVPTLCTQDAGFVMDFVTIIVAIRFHISVNGLDGLEIKLSKNIQL